MPNILYTPVSFLEPQTTPPDILAKWDDLGLLEGLDAEKKNTCAQYFETAVQRVLSTDSDNQDLRLQLTLPIVRRVVTGSDDLVDIQHLLDATDDFIFNHYKERTNALQAEVDPELSAIVEFCDNYKPPLFTKLRQLSL